MIQPDCVLAVPLRNLLIDVKPTLISWLLFINGELTSELHGFEDLDDLTEESIYSLKF